MYIYIFIYYTLYNIYRAGPSGRAVYGVGLHPLACCNRGFESHRDMDVCLLCVLSGRGPYDELITLLRGILPTVVCRCV
jgi:hypothetical protein